jgi:plastocyanin
MKLVKAVVLQAPLVALALAAPARAAAPAKTGAQSTDKMAAQIEKLEAEVREQRQLIMQLVRVEQEHYDLLLRLVQGRGVAPVAEPGTPPAAPSAPGAPAAAAATPGAASAAAGAAKLAAPRTGSLRGKVEFSGGPIKDLYVYVENVKSPPAHGHTFEIAQRDKQFVPEVAVVQRGTKVTFPNYDTVFHNVFSPTSPHPFDLGSYRAGDAAKSVELTSPGVVDVFCNVHSRMHASVLVVPSSLYVRVAADGSFHMDGVPLGSRKIVVWSPRSKPATQTVEVGPGGADVTFTLEAQPQAPHNNKFGQPYSSYKE